MKFSVACEQELVWSVAFHRRLLVSWPSVSIWCVLIWLSGEPLHGADIVQRYSWLVCVYVLVVCSLC